MSLPLYAQLLTPPLHSQKKPGEIAEPRSQYAMLSERHLQAMWLEQKYFRNLVTSEGLPIHIISSGIWNTGPGPDFLKAHLKIGQQELRGDIELHLADEGWYHHKHHLDPNYNEVILHISYSIPASARPIITANSKNISRTYLEKALTISETRILNLIDLELYPYAQFSGSGTCANSLFRYLSEKEKREFFSSAAEWRLIQKQHALEAQMTARNPSVAVAIAKALGYKQNVEAFAHIYALATAQKFVSEKQFFAYSLGVCGFFHEKYLLKWKNSSLYQELSALYRSLNVSNEMPYFSLNLNKIRPPSHPVRRLAVLAKIAIDHTLEELPSRLINLWNQCWPQLVNEKDRRKFIQKISDLLPHYEDSYWECHFAFEENPQNKRMQLIGKDLKQEMIVNILLPILYENIRQDKQKLEVFKNFYDSFPAPKTHKSNYLRHRFFGNSPSNSLLDKTSLQQGSYQLHKDFCIHFEASCQGCPFVSRYKTTFKNLPQKPS